MLRLLRTKNISSTLQQCKRCYIHANKSSSTAMCLSKTVRRTMSTSAQKTSDSTLAVMGVGLLCAASGLAYYNMKYSDEIGSQTKKAILPSIKEEKADIESATSVNEATDGTVVVAEETTTEETAYYNMKYSDEIGSQTKKAILPSIKEEKADIESATSVNEATDGTVVVAEETTTEETVSEDESPENVAVVASTPQDVPYVIIGAGTAAHAACRTIRRNEPDAKILIVGEEDVFPYMRPPLSKELWFSENSDVGKTLKFKSWNGKERSVFFEDSEFYVTPEELDTKETGGVAVITGKKVTAIDAPNHSIELESGENIQYRKLLISTGGKPKNLSALANASDDILKHTTLFRNVANFRQLDEVMQQCENVVVVGGGFLGSELVCALAASGKSRGLKVSQVYPEAGNMAKVLPRYLSEWTTRKVQKEGVNVISNRSIKNVKYDSDNKNVNVELDDGRTILADHMVVCVGLEPNIELAKSAGLEIDEVHGGFRVNSELEARSDIWVAGDASCFYDINLGRRRVEHHDHAVVSGRLAGANMTGAKKSYTHQSMFWSDLGPDVGYEATGLVDSTLPTVGIWASATPADTPKASVEATGESVRSEAEAISGEVTEEKPNTQETPVTIENEDEEEFGKGVVFYMKEKKIVGVLLWNIFSQMPLARSIISEGKDHEDLNTVARLFKIHP